jgi:hypothetical protein
MARMRSLLLVTLLFAGACTDVPVETRVCNRTGYEITTLEPYSNRVLETMAEDTCTPYVIQHADAYVRSGAVFEIGTDRFEYLPLDFVGQPPLEPGRWSYELRITDYSARMFSSAAVED